MKTFASSWSIVVGRGSMLTPGPVEHMGTVGICSNQLLQKSGFTKNHSFSKKCVDSRSCNGLELLLLSFTSSALRIIFRTMENNLLPNSRWLQTLLCQPGLSKLRPGKIKVFRAQANSKISELLQLLHSLNSFAPFFMTMIALKC